MRTFVIDEGFLAWIAGDDAYINIICGTGALARDFRRKLRLLRVDVPFLVGAEDNPEDGIRDYRNLATLENPEKYRFIVCCDVDEWDLIGPVQSALYRLVGLVSYSHPRVIRLTSDFAFYGQAGDLLADAHIHNVFLRAGRPFRLFGDADENAFDIHVFGASNSSSIFSCVARSWPDLLYEKLWESGVGAAVYSWGQPRATSADMLVAFLRDGRFYRPSLVVVCGGTNGYNPLSYSEKNVLSVRTGQGEHEFMETLHGKYDMEICDGLRNGELDFDEVTDVQIKIFRCLSALYGFGFWHVLTPSPDCAAEGKARALTGMSTGYLGRMRERAERITGRNGDCTKDFTDVFDDIEDIFSMYTDLLHPTEQGNEIIARRFAEEILREFGPETGRRRNLPLRSGGHGPAEWQGGRQWRN
jgi:hypothetical protein